MAKYDIDSISVKSPCNESWDEMSGNDEIRFCSHCAKSVHNLSGLSRTEVERLIEISNGRLCVRYEKTQQGRLVTALPRTSQIKRQSLVAAGVLASSLALSTFVCAQSKLPLKDDTGQVQTDNSQKKNPVQDVAAIFGIVTDATGAVIPGTKVTLHNVKADELRITQSNNEGFYEFKDVAPGIYQIEVEMPGFKKLIQNDIESFPSMKMEKNLSLEAGVLLGEIVIVDFPVVETPDSKPVDKVDSIKLTPVTGLPKMKKKKTDRKF